MKERLIIDTSVYLNYAAYGKLYRLVNAIELYELQVFINATLIAEIERNLEKALVDKTFSKMELMLQIERCTTKISVIPLFNNYPDKKDNFLFDLALQSSSELIVTKEKALLSWPDSPVPIHDIKWFKETYRANL